MGPRQFLGGEGSAGETLHFKPWGIIQKPHPGKPAAPACRIGPVSYTHLDVYKRQALGYLRTSEPLLSLRSRFPSIPYFIYIIPHPLAFVNSYFPHFIINFIQKFLPQQVLDNLPRMH